MPEHKRQHYVHRGYFKEFSLDREGNAINLFNIQRAQAIPNAPLKGQCARDYFYGEDLKLEKALQSMEGYYGTVIRRLVSGSSPSEADLSLLREFALLQYTRTDMACKRLRATEEGMDELVYSAEADQSKRVNLSPRRIMRLSMKTYSSGREYISDLKVCIMRNETTHDFVTSDDPSIFTNRFRLQRLKDTGIGFMSSGSTFFLPLTPRLMLICYDGNVYSVPRENHFVPLSNKKDIYALNELQYLKGAENIYFSKWGDRERLAQEFASVQARRPASWSEFEVYVHDGIEDGRERYRLANPEERHTATHTMISTKSIGPAPSSWVSKMQFRSKLTTYNNGTAVGHVRKEEWLHPSVFANPWA